ncbi:hypothetical protein V6N13_040388 [Hibiscus sabdariffa]
MDATQVTASAKGGTRDYFRFDNCWSKEEACIERVRSAWLHSPGSTISKLQAIGDSLRSWQADRCVSSTKRMSDLQGFLNSCMQGSITDEAKAAFLDAKREHKSGHMVREPRTASGCVRALGAGDSDSIGRCKDLGCGSLGWHRDVSGP